MPRRREYKPESEEVTRERLEAAHRRLDELEIGCFPKDSEGFVSDFISCDTMQSHTIPAASEGA